MKLRDFQQDIRDQVVSATSHDLFQLDTVAGKTPTQAAIAQAAPRVQLLEFFGISVSVLKPAEGGA